MRAMSEKQFYRHFTPLANDLDMNASWDGCMYETFGAELFYVKRYDERHVWTIIECDDGQWYLSPGYHFINRIGYIITKQPHDGVREVKINNQ